MTNKVKVRFAPSPSGFMHLGNARVALLNYLYAAKMHGEFMLRVDDTDAKTTDANNIDQIMRDLKALGVVIHGVPVYQSSRKAHYQMLAEKLLKRGLVYRCFCTQAMLDKENRAAKLAKQPPRYSGRCKRLTPDELASKSGQEYALRFDVEKCGVEAVHFNDAILGEVNTPLQAFGDFIIVRENGMASYNFASAVDDMDFGITHIVRGSDHLTNSAKQYLLWQALGGVPPQLAHLSLLAGEGGAPLSKREGDVSVVAMIQRGYLPAAISHYLASIGVSDLPQVSVASLQELAQHFSWPKSSGVAHYEAAKLDFFNKLYLHASTGEQLLENYKAYQMQPATPLNDTEILRTLELFKDNATTVSQALAVHTYYSDDTAWAYAKALPALQQLVAANDFEKLLQSMRQLLASSHAELDWLEFVKQLVEQAGLPKKSVYMGMRLLLIGAAHGPELPRILQWLGLAKLKKRLGIN